MNQKFPHIPFCLVIIEGDICVIQEGQYFQLVITEAIQQVFWLTLLDLPPFSGRLFGWRIALGIFWKSEFYDSVITLRERRSRIRIKCAGGFHSRFGFHQEAYYWFRVSNHSRRAYLWVR